MQIFYQMSTKDKQNQIINLQLVFFTQHQNRNSREKFAGQNFPSVRKYLVLTKARLLLVESKETFYFW